MILQSSDTMQSVNAQIDVDVDDFVDVVVYFNCQ